MGKRRVTQVEKNLNGEVFALCNANEDWSPRRKQDAIQDIESLAHSYYVQWPDKRQTQILVVEGRQGQYLRTDRDLTGRNNLLELPEG